MPPARRNPVPRATAGSGQCRGGGVSCPHCPSSPTFLSVKPPHPGPALGLLLCSRRRSRRGFSLQRLKISPRCGGAAAAGGPRAGMGRAWGHQDSTRDLLGGRDLRVRSSGGFLSHLSGASVLPAGGVPKEGVTGTRRGSPVLGAISLRGHGAIPTAQRHPGAVFWEAAG